METTNVLMSAYSFDDASLLNQSLDSETFENDCISDDCDDSDDNW